MMRYPLLLTSLVLLLMGWMANPVAAQSEEKPDSGVQKEVGEHDDSKLTTPTDVQDSDSGKKRKKKKKNLDALVEGKTQEDLEETNKEALTKEEKEYIKKKEKKKAAQKKIDDATRKRTEKIINSRQKKAKNKVKKNKNTYLKTH